MLLHISEQSPDTLQEQILTQIRARILCGELEADQSLPSIRVLAKDLRVSVITVQRAYESLLNEGLIYARRSKGYFVASLPDSDKSALAQQRYTSRLEELLRDARRDGLEQTELEAIFARLVKEEE